MSSDPKASQAQMEKIVSLCKRRGFIYQSSEIYGGCAGVSVSGVRWPLDHADLAPAIGLGVSNVTTDDVVEISLTAGVLTIFVKDHLDDHLDDPSEHP